MTFDEFISVMSEDMSRIISENNENILRNIVDGLPNDKPCITEEQLLMCRNAVKVSVHLSIQMVFMYLNSIEMLDLEHIKQHFESPAFEIIDGGLPPKE